MSDWLWKSTIENTFHCGTLSNKTACSWETVYKAIFARREAEVREKLTEMYGPLPICKYFNVDGVCNFPSKPVESECVHILTRYRTFVEYPFKEPKFEEVANIHCPRCGEKLK